MRLQHVLEGPLCMHGLWLKYYLSASDINQKQEKTLNIKPASLSPSLLYLLNMLLGAGDVQTNWTQSPVPLGFGLVGFLRCSL